MSPVPIPIPILAAGRCDSCHAGSSGPVCRRAFGTACEAPQLRGAPEALARVMDALAGSLGGPPPVRSLALADGEAELVLDLPVDCGTAALADAAFHTLRALLPDTDIYVRRAA